MAPIPGDIKSCLHQTVGDPKNIQTKAQVVRLVAKLKASENAKTKCGRRLIALYERHRSALGPRNAKK